MKSEEQIKDAIANACEDDRLRFQVIIQDSILHIYINRPTQVNLNYHQLKHQIYGVVANLSPINFRRIWFYCRILGEIEPDWQSVLDLEATDLAADEMVSMVQEITTALDATNSIVDRIEQQLEIPESFLSDPQIDFEDLPTTAADQEESLNLSESELSEMLDDSVAEFNQQSEVILDLSKYCFIRNRRLLYAVLDPPWEKVARIINTFDQFEQSIKRSQLPVLEAYFEELKTPELKNLTSEVQGWWRSIEQLDSDNRHKLAIWLSRYCLDTKQTRVTIGEVLFPQAAVVETKPLSSSQVKSNVEQSKSKSGFFTSIVKFMRNLSQIFPSKK